jgi:3-hydroxyisobutyrate dehydrogenase-like beta-hydroxyacid dehydrogenase
MKVGFVGLGNMGYPMAANVVKRGHDLTVYNRTRAKAERFHRETGAGVAESPAEAVADAEVVITMLYDAASLTDVYPGDDGIAGALRAGQVAVEMSTSGPQAIEWLGRIVTPTGAALIDAPVSGSLTTAETGHLLIMVGGEADAVEQARPVLEAMGRSVVHLGALGCGATMKLAVNSIVYGLNQSLSEALVLAERSGISRSVAYDIFAESPIAAPAVHYRREVFEHPGGPVRSLSIRGSEKDLRLALGLAEQLGTPMGQARYNVAVLGAARRAGFGDRDVGEVAEYLRQTMADATMAAPPAVDIPVEGPTAL